MKTSRHDIQENITATIIAALEKGAGDWKMPWHSLWRCNYNILSKRAYRGINFIMLCLCSLDGKYTSQHWGTFKQWKEQGAMIRKGEKGAPIIFYKKLAILDKHTQEPKDIPLLRQTFAFNLAQVENAPSSLTMQDDLQPFHSHDDIDAIIAKTGARIDHMSTIAAYSPTRDVIVMPPKHLFESSATSTREQSYYSVMFHELAHWSGHASRLNRPLSIDKASVDYHFEELIAQLSAAFTCAHVGLTPTPREDDAAYIAVWIDMLKSDPTAIFRAASAAAKATDFILAVEDDTAHKESS